MAYFRRVNLRALLIGSCVLGLSGCADGLDLDFRGAAGGLDTTEAARGSTQNRPDPDDRGIISYPNFQVAVARRGDTVDDVAARVGVDAAGLAKYNGIDRSATLRRGEVIALPERVSGTAPATAPLEQPENIDITTLAGDALDRADANAPASSTTPFQSRPTPTQTGAEPVQHKVARGETAYSIARLYRVSVRSLADWNGLGPDLGVREGQFLMIPVASQTAALASPEPVTDVTAPGQGSPTPEPPSASTPLPEEPIAPVVAAPAPAPASPALSGERTSASGTAKLTKPVSGNIIRSYEKGKTDGIGIAAAAGTPVKAAADGTIAAITRDTDGVPILVLRHTGNLLTVYANIDNVTLAKGAIVSAGQTIAEVRGTSPSFLHFEVREGFESVDPVPYLN